MELIINIVFSRLLFRWEKFNWFITSDNYLVIGGRDAQQNEVIVKRYLRPGDAYLHADVHGAASCILRAKRQRDPNGASKALPLSEQALREAGTFTICKSSAWASKMVTSAWWVDSHQVSKVSSNYVESLYSKSRFFLSMLNIGNFLNDHSSRPPQLVNT